MLSTLFIDMKAETTVHKVTPNLYGILSFDIFSKIEPVADVKAMAVVKQAKAMAIAITNVPTFPNMEVEI
ncbi:hypothetical protein CCYN2B_20017 [Capnocytophaga cynodegmi]|uniref:Uncharacterized protein n=1 Tax=Capnocytophaga cynodegmi TaxID=28189 RepID=A0A0B7H465_9FLAO|nr:hypothetical protein CCYN2B_20017 [Capnocytophaga cynodegmi]